MSAIEKYTPIGHEPTAHLTVVSDAMHALLVKRADELEGCIEGSPEEAEIFDRRRARGLRANAVAAWESAGRQGLRQRLCNLYSLNRTRDGIARFFRVSHNRAAAFEPLPAIFPGRVAPVVRQSADGERELVLMNWGYVLLQNGLARSASPMYATTQSSKAGSGEARSKNGAV